MPYEDEFFEEELDEMFDAEDFYDEEIDEDEEADFDDFDAGDYDQLIDAAMEGDSEAEDEFLGALAGLAAKALPAIAGAVVPRVVSFAKGLFRRRKRRTLRRLPRTLRRAKRNVRRAPRRVRWNPRYQRRVLHRCLRPRPRRYYR